jgi:hypothetical protein
MSINIVRPILSSHDVADEQICRFLSTLAWQDWLQRDRTCRPLVAVRKVCCTLDGQFNRQPKGEDNSHRFTPLERTLPLIPPLTGIPLFGFTAASLNAFARSSSSAFFSAAFRAVSDASHAAWSAASLSAASRTIAAASYHQRCSA